MKTVKNITNIILIIFFGITMVCFVFILVVLLMHSSLPINNLGNIGDFMSGTIGVLLSFISFLLMWWTFHTQRKQFGSQMELQKQTSFESTYFNLLSSLDQVRDNAMAILIGNENAKTIAEWYKLLRKEFDNHESEVIIQSADVDSQVEATQGVVARLYENFVKEHGYIGFYFRYVYNTIYFVIKSWQDESNRKKYINLLCAKLSDEELALLFYNALSKYGRDQNERLRFKDILDKYQVFENLNKDYLIDRSHFRLYSHTDFKFLNRDERNNYLKSPSLITF